MEMKKHFTDSGDSIFFEDFDAHCWWGGGDAGGCYGCEGEECDGENVLHCWWCALVGLVDIEGLIVDDEIVIDSSSD